MNRSADQNAIRLYQSWTSFPTAIPNSAGSSASNSGRTARKPCSSGDKGVDYGKKEFSMLIYCMAMRMIMNASKMVMDNQIAKLAIMAIVLSASLARS